MTSWVALLRAVNVGGRKVIMTDLKAMAQELGLADARTYIASGNLLFTSDRDEADLKSALETRLQAYLGKPCGVMLRNAEDMAAVAAANPFLGRAPNHTVALFLDAPPPPDALASVRNQAGEEEVALGRREIYVFYGSGMGRSKLAIPAAAKGTARNMNTVAKLAELAAQSDGPK